jgi:hypothetical protein
MGAKLVIILYVLTQCRDLLINLTYKNFNFSSWSRSFVSVAGLLAPDQLASIFLNVEQLIQVASDFL